MSNLQKSKSNTRKTSKTRASKTAANTGRNGHAKTPKQPGLLSGKSIKAPDGSGMTIFQRRFVDEFLVDCDPTMAIRRAGFSGKNARKCAARMRKVPAVMSAIKVGLDAISKRCEADQRFVLDRLKLIADGNIQDVVTFDEDGTAVFDPQLMARDKAYAIDSYEIVQGGGGGQKRSGRNQKTGSSRGPTKIKIKMRSAQEALNKLGVFTGLFRDEPQQIGEVRFVLEGAPPMKLVNGPGVVEGSAQFVSEGAGEKVGG